MNKRFLAIASAAVFTAFTTAAHADPVDLTSWSALTLNYPGGQSAGNWVLGNGNTQVEQTVNADPSFFLNNLDLTSYSIDGTWQVRRGTGDDDYMGFVFGYQNSSNFYLFDWKQGTQGYAGATAYEGMTIKQFTGATGDGLADLSIKEFWENRNDTGDLRILGTNQGNNGWAPSTEYTFHLDFNIIPGTFSIAVSQGNDVLWDTTVNSSTFTTGQFGFFNNSQSNVVYSGFTQDVVPPVTPVPEPETYALMAAGLAALGWVGRRRARKEGRRLR